MTVLGGAIGELVGALGALGRDDLVARALAAETRLRRPPTTVCVVGEAGQGKSSLVNGLVGTDVCPVDDRPATSVVTVVRFGDVPSAVVRRRVGGRQVDEEIPVDELVGRSSGSDDQERIERVEIAAPSTILDQGLTLVDTPGMGGIGAGHAAATLAFLPFADGLVFVSDTAAELRAPEIGFLRRAVELCPAVLVVQTKTDRCPGWERILDRNRRHLAGAGVDVPLMAVSSVLRSEALARRDRGLNLRSGYPGLIDALGTGIVEPARAVAEERARADIRAITGLVRSALDDERTLLDEPRIVARAAADLQRAGERLDHLRGPDATWHHMVRDRIAELCDRIGHELRSGLRTAAGHLGRELQTLVAEEVTRAVVALAQGRADVHAQVVALLRDEHLLLPSVRGRPPDVVELWADDAELTGDLCSRLPLSDDPVLDLARLANDLEQELRDALGARLAELHRSCTETAQLARQIAHQTKEQAKRRSTEIAAADAVLAKVAALAGPPAAARRPAPARHRTPEPTRR